MSGLAAVLAFVRLGRPRFLVGGFVLFGLGAAIARWRGFPVDPLRYALGQAAVTAFQLMTHYANDYFDYEADLANTTPTKFSGGSRVLAGGAIRRELALTAALVLAGLGVVATAGIAVTVDVATARVAGPLLSLTFILAWGYSAPPLRLCATGAGELDTALVVTGLVPLLGFALQAHGLAGADLVLVAILPLACLQVAMLLAIEVPDAAGDAATGKRTLVVRLGARRASVVHAGVLALASLGLVLMCVRGIPGAGALLAIVPLLAWQAVRFRRAIDAPAAWERLALWSVILLVGTAIAELIVFVAGAA